MSVPMFPVATELASRVSFLGTSAVSSVEYLPKICKANGFSLSFSLQCFISNVLSFCPSSPIYAFLILCNVFTFKMS